MRLVIRVVALAVVFSVAASLALSAERMTVLDDRDWRGPGAVARSEGIERAVTPELLLKTEIKEPVFLFDPTDDETITAITDFQGKLYLGSCTEPGLTKTGSVHTYDPETNEWQKVFRVNDEGLLRLVVYGDCLYIPGHDADDGGWDLGNIYVHNGKSWVEHRTVPRAIHEYGLAIYRGRIYVSADILDPAPPGMTLEEGGGEKKLIPLYGRVVSSGDGGVTWREEYRARRVGQDIGFMTVWRDKLIVNVKGDLVVFDGDHWRPLGLNPAALVVLDYADAGDLLAMGTSLGLCFYDGQRFWRFPRQSPLHDHVRGVRRFGSQWVILVNSIPGATLRLGPGGFYPILKQGHRPFNSLMLVMSERRFRELASEEGEHGPKDISLVDVPEFIASAHVFKGRLYIGTHPEGRVLVLPVVKEGMLDSAPRPVVNAGAYTVSWEAATPAGTHCRLQIRTASTREMLEKQPFVGPDGTDGSCFEVPGAALRIAQPGFVQYRVLLKTENPALTPYLKRITLRSSMQESALDPVQPSHR